MIKWVETRHGPIGLIGDIKAFSVRIRKGQIFLESNLPQAKVPCAPIATPEDVEAEAQKTLFDWLKRSGLTL